MMLRSSAFFMALFTLALAAPAVAMHSDSEGDYEEQSKKRSSKRRKVTEKDWVSDQEAAKLLMGLSPKKNVPQTKRPSRLRGPRSVSSLSPSAPLIINHFHGPMTIHMASHPVAEDRAFLDALWAEIEKAAPGALPAAKAAQPRVEGRHSGPIPAMVHGTPKGVSTEAHTFRRPMGQKTRSRTAGESMLALDPIARRLSLELEGVEETSPVSKKPQGQRHVNVRKPRPLGERTRRGCGDGLAFMLDASGKMAILDEGRRLRKRAASPSKKP